MAGRLWDWSHRIRSLDSKRVLWSTITPDHGGTALDGEWNEGQPIYRQLRERVVAMILDGDLREGDPLPSVRHVAAEYRVNPLTVLKAFQSLADEQLVEKKRGLGMFITTGARRALLQAERQRFLAEQWPRIRETIERLGLTPEDLLTTAPARRGSKR